MNLRLEANYCTFIILKELTILSTKSYKIELHNGHWNAAKEKYFVKPGSNLPLEVCLQQHQQTNTKISWNKVIIKSMNHYIKGILKNNKQNDR